MNEQLDLENLWMDTFKPYMDNYCKADRDYKKLDKKTQLIGSLAMMELDMFNGGFIQFFCNWGYDAYLFAVEGLEMIGAFEAKKILTDAYAIISKDEYMNNPNVKAYWDIPSILSEEDTDTIWNVLDHKYWEKNDDVLTKMLNYFKD